MPYTGPDWPEFRQGDRLHVHRVFDPPHQPSGSRLAQWSGVMVSETSRYGFSLRIDDSDGGGQRFHAWDPGPSCHQTITRIPH
ncbi:hypothetical protein [Nocardia sp. NBC_00511]|uniref:hypothetical protein n=1 Tax=Nocardia sp. NBC_00511 TaxID=2903591 RepID=UPI002F90B412